MNIEKYKNGGWGLSEKCFEQIFNIIKAFNTSINVVEFGFGSGISTEFLVDAINEGYDFVQKFMMIYESSVEIFKLTEPKDRFVIFKIL